MIFVISLDKTIGGKNIDYLVLIIIFKNNLCEKNLWTFLLSL